MQPLPVADKGNKKSFAVVKIYKIKAPLVKGGDVIEDDRGDSCKSIIFTNICFYIFRRKHGGVVPFFRVAKERHQESKSGGMQQVAIPPNNPLNIRKTATLSHWRFCLASNVKKGTQ